MRRPRNVQNPPSAPTSELVSYRKPDGLILSTGNLYFTYHDEATASVWRAAQTAVPGQEILLYSEPGGLFGDIVYAEVDGAFWGYFFSGDGVTASIKRVPLTGGAATVVATMTNVDIENSHQNLVTDGVNLYWQDVDSVRKVPIGGGPITVLDQAESNTPTAGLALQNGNLSYASVSNIRYVPVGGSAVPPAQRTIFTTSQRVTTLHAVLEFIYWGDDSGVIGVVLADGSSPETIATTGGLVPTSISTSVHGGVYAQPGRNAARNHVNCTSTSPRERIRFTPLPPMRLAYPWRRQEMSSGVTPPACIGISRTERRFRVRHRAESDRRPELRLATSRGAPPSRAAQGRR